MKILIACEESQEVCKAFRELGFEAYSCDLQECSGGHPEWHINGDAITEAYSGKYDMMIAHPPYTFLAVSGARWYYNPEDSNLPFKERRPHPKFPNRVKDKEEALEFFIKLLKAPIRYIAVENPVSIVSTRYKKPNQTIHPWMFGEEASKATCLWLKNLPLLKPTNIVGKGERIYLSSGKSLPKWYNDALVNSNSAEERRSLRSKTFIGIATAMAKQWGDFIISQL
jgi:hypothetical protein